MFKKFKLSLYIFKGALKLLTTPYQKHLNSLFLWRADCKFTSRTLNLPCRSPKVARIAQKTLQEWVGVPGPPLEGGVGMAENLPIYRPIDKGGWCYAIRSR